MAQRPFIVYRSSAGSGKTFTLAKAFLRMALSSPNPLYFKSLLALTFTVKAAHEMKDRIITYLAAIAQNDLSRRSDVVFMVEELSAELEMDKATLQERCSNCLQAVLHNYGDLSIYTIDKFIHRIIRSVASDLGLQRDFDVDVDSKELLSRVLESFYEEVGSNNELHDLTLKYLTFELNQGSSFNIDRSILEVAQILLSEEYYFKRNKLLEINTEKVQLEIDEIQRKIALCYDELTQIGRQAMQLISSTGLEYNDFHQGARGIYGKFDQAAKGDLDKATSMNNYVKQTLEEGKWKSAKGDLAVETISPQLQALAESLFSKSKAFEEIQFLEKLQPFLYKMGMISTLEDLFAKVKEERNVLSISDFTRILTERIILEQTPYIYERIGTRFNHILVDEFQDTSSLQWVSLRPIFENALAEGNETLIVGDAKQSIYRFRGADVSQFERLPQTAGFDSSLFESSYLEETLQYNFRSSPTIVDFNNRFFKQFGDKQTSFAKADQSPRLTHSGSVKWSFIEDPKNAKDNLLLSIMLDQLNKDVAEEKVTPGGICCLFLKNAQASEFASMLLAAGYNVVSDESLLIKNDPEVRFLIATAQCLRQPKDLYHRANWASTLHQMRSMEHFHEEMIRITKSNESFQRIWNSMGLRKISGVFSSSNTYTYFKSIADAAQIDCASPFISKFLDVCMEFEKQSKYLNEPFLDFWQEQNDKWSIELQDNENAIRVMTIHKSKGLEFQTVYCYLPYPNKSKISDFTWFNWEESKHMNWVFTRTGYLKSTPHEAVFEAQQNMAESDLVNAIYVAFTRARTNLRILSYQDDDLSELFREWPEWSEDQGLLALG